MLIGVDLDHASWNVSGRKAVQVSYGRPAFMIWQRIGNEIKKNDVVVANSFLLFPSLIHISSPIVQHVREQTETDWSLDIG